ncbi:DnaJ-domain-containing protein [Tilletiaria anomala UBC 951]|uniref:DnaJ-domain-containing protein n=1 Tax=Tilletiaria anomala (strain ATCC 24038 / CBS 436.72 / UBC 951) TaxID=1037660 RepID=A0A066WRU7_TILAU|nr:DnaJ-domain-containing protein [Tilletiaria anomala UBC 951]KDN53365.1 DnaJ-domain-containing protein [Tilletiaria anomala UBC 951]
MPADIDLYEVLGVARDANQEDIRTAYRRQALKTHPDRALPERKEECTAQFKLVAEAYEVLSDPSKRREYDTAGSHSRFAAQPSSTNTHNAFGQCSFSSRNRPSGGFGFDFSDPFQMFEDLFGRNFGVGHGEMASPFGQRDPFFANHQVMADMGFGLNRSMKGHQFGESAFGPSDPFAFGCAQPMLGGLFGRSMFNDPSAGGMLQPMSMFGTGDGQQSSQSSMRSFSSFSKNQSGGFIPNPQSVQSNSRSIYQSNRNGQIETVTREIAPDGTETIYRSGPQGAFVTVNGEPQPEHPLLQGRTTRQRVERTNASP